MLSDRVPAVEVTHSYTIVDSPEALYSLSFINNRSSSIIVGKYVLSRDRKECEDGVWTKEGA